MISQLEVSIVYDIKYTKNSVNYLEISFKTTLRCSHDVPCEILAKIVF